MKEFVAAASSASKHNQGHSEVDMVIGLSSRLRAERADGCMGIMAASKSNIIQIISHKSLLPNVMAIKKE
eukprot:CCRYP_005372-RA/>CCRYP_005372-RA protein AED:0.22 eAED:0.35 QI:720/0/0.5/1/0/0/2/0/69